MYNLQVTVDATETPVTLAEAKAFMRVTSSYEDDLITALIVSATSTLEAFTSRSFVSKTYQMDIDRILVVPHSYPFVSLPRSPLDSVTSFQGLQSDSYVDVSYNTKLESGFPRLVIDDENIYNLDDVVYPLRAIFVAGYGDADDVPQSIKQAIMMQVGFMYSNRGECCSDASNITPGTVQALLMPYQLRETFSVY